MPRTRKPKERAVASAVPPSVTTAVQPPVLEDPIYLSAINQFVYCPRRCGLMVLEAEFADNLHTQLGTYEHERVDHSGQITQAGAQVLYALPVWHGEKNLIGRCDVVEIWKDGTIYPVEYKHGARRKWLNDDLQLVAQAVCLEAMFGRPVERGGIFHAASKRRREVAFTATLRARLDEVLAELTALLAQDRLPPPTPMVARCGDCSLKNICQPEVFRQPDRLRTEGAALFAIDED